MERETLEMDVVFVGAGPANLSGALHLARLVKQHNESIAKGEKQGEALGEIEIGVIEKGSSVGAHILSGAVMDPRALRELLPDFVEQGAPLESPVKEDYFLYLTEKRAIRSPITPPPFKNHGYYIVSLNRLTAWLGDQCEAAGVNVFPEFPGADMLYDEEDRVVGVRTGDKGIDKEGKRKANFEPGVDLRAKVTVLGEGPRGSLTKQLSQRLNLNEGKEPQVYSVGVKELWELPDDRYPAGPGNPHSGFSFRHSNVWWRLDLRNAESHLEHRLRDRARLQGSLARSTCRVSTVQIASVRFPVARRRQDASLRRQDDRRRGLLRDAENLCGRSVVSWRLRRVLELATAQGHPFCDQERNVGG